MDSFFGFDTSRPEFSNEGGPDVASGGKRSPISRYYMEDESDAEQEYDALNDETFGAADKGDWEHIHERLVRLESGVKEDDAASSSELDDYPGPTLQLDDYDDLDLKFNFYDTNDESGRSSVVGAQSIGDEFASKLRLDPSIWGSPLKVAVPDQHKQQQQQQQLMPQALPPGVPQLSTFQHSTSSTALQMNIHNPSQPPFATGLPSNLTPPVKMLSVEDIERNIIQQQQLKLKEHQQKILQQQQQQQQQKLFAQQQQAALRNQRKQAHPSRSIHQVREILSTTAKDCALKAQPISMLPPSITPLGTAVPPGLSPPQLLATRSALFPSVPAHGHPAHLLAQAARLPLSMLPPYNLLSAAQFAGPINNLAMHPAFPHAALGSHGLHGLLPAAGPIASLGQQRHPAAPTPILLQPNPSTVQNNQFNQRLVQEIQQNHPLLAFNRQQQQLAAGMFGGISSVSSSNLNHQKHTAGHYVYHHHQQQYLHQQQQHRNNNGIPKAALGTTVNHDEYANLMSNREKQWLLGIQLMQLNSDWPYFSDYYFTVFKERLAALKGESHANRAYTDNRRNHPLTQPKGHAQLLLMSSMAKAVGAGRERKSSDSSKHAGACTTSDGKADGGGRTYTPLQFENSLGKLQCGSVTAPRKIIDMDVMGGDERDVNGNGVNQQEYTVCQRKTRHVLLLIETLYRTVLKLEDLLNPTAILAITLLREKRERERDASNVDDAGTGAFKGTPVAGLSEHEESFDELAASLVGSLTQEKTTSILGVRKGKILMRRILMVLHRHPFRWALWAMIFEAIPCLPRKDRDDSDGHLFCLYAEFERHVHCATAADLVRLSKSLRPRMANGGDTAMQAVVSCKLLLSATITAIFQMETICATNPRAIETEEDESLWVAFLQDINRAVRKGHTDAPAKSGCPVWLSSESNIVRTLRRHFQRFNARADGTELMNFITNNGNGSS